MSAVIGVDPGVNGGISVLGHNGAVLHVQGFKGTMTEKELVAEVSAAVAVLGMAGGGPAFVETVGYMPGDGGQGAFTFGKVCGLLRGALLAKGIIVVGVYPQTWQAKMECMSGGNKNVTKSRAVEIFHNIKMTHAIADCLLIAEYGRRVIALREDPLNQTEA